MRKLKLLDREEESDEYVSPLLRTNRGGKTRVKRSIKQEKECAVSVKGKRVPGSGNRWFAKGDVSADGTLTECKFTEFSQYTLKEADLKQIRAKGVLVHKLGVMQIEFINGSKYAIIPWEVWEEAVNGCR
jgi:hypothetical protein